MCVCLLCLLCLDGGREECSVLTRMTLCRPRGWCVAAASGNPALSPCVLSAQPDVCPAAECGVEGTRQRANWGCRPRGKPVGPEGREGSPVEAGHQCSRRPADRGRRFGSRPPSCLLTQLLKPSQLCPLRDLRLSRVGRHSESHRVLNCRLHCFRDPATGVNESQCRSRRKFPSWPEPQRRHCAVLGNVHLLIKAISYTKTPPFDLFAGSRWAAER